VSFRFQFRRGTTAERNASNPILAAGEPAVVLDSGQPAELVLGDGVTAMADLRSAVWDDDARLALAGTATQPGDLGTAAAADVADLATAAQGANADTAVQPAGVDPATAAAINDDDSDTVTALRQRVAMLQPKVPSIPAAAVSVQSPTDITASGVHPDVVDAGPSKWNGWRYWMIYTPYWRSTARYENPVILVSDDGQNWVEPAGIVNPIDPKPAAALNSDPDMVLVGGTMYAYYRQHDPISKTEQIMLRTSTDGITWSAEQTVLDTTGTSPTDRMNLISPAVVHTGAQFVMYYSKFSVINRRTSADGVTWSAEASVTGVANAVAHIDATRGSDGRTHLFMQMSGNHATTESGSGSQVIRIAKSTDGIAFSVGATPLLVSEHMAQRMVYRTCGLVEARNGKDYYRLWASCVSLGLSETAASVTAGTVESYYIGYTEGYDPNDPAPQDKTSLYPPGDVIAGGTVRGKRMGALSIWGRFVVGVRAAFDKLSAHELHAGHAYIDGGNFESSQTVVPPEWASRLGYSIGQQTPTLTIGSRADTQTADAIIALHNTSPGNLRAAAEGWHISVNANGHLHIHQRAADGTRTSRGFLAYESGDMVWNRRGYFLSVGTTESITAGQKIIISGNALQINTASTPSSSSNAPGTVGEIRRDENYIYVMTSVGWKRAALSTW